MVVMGERWWFWWDGGGDFGCGGGGDQWWWQRSRRSREGGNVIFLRGTGSSVPEKNVGFLPVQDQIFFLKFNVYSTYSAYLGYLPGEVFKRHSVYKYSLDSTN